MSRRLSRRALLGGAAATGAAGALGLAGCSSAEQAAPVARSFAGGQQVGVAEPVAAFGLMAAFDVVDADRAALARTLQTLSVETARLVDGTAPEERDRRFPPADTGVVTGDRHPRITVSVGASLFDDRFGLADRRPAELVPMPYLANDRLDPARTHGDLLVTVSADAPDVCLHALRQVMRATRAGLAVRWVLDGYNRADAVHTPGRTENRNLLGFKDGTANLDPTEAEVMDRFVWVGGDRNGGAEPPWAVGGTYQVVRVIRMFVEQWDRASLAEQEDVIGRRKVSGAPLDGRREEDDPDFAGDPDGRTTPLDAHIRLARPRTADTEHQRLLRRGFSYSRGHDASGLLDQGLAFVSYSRTLGQFLAVNDRLRGEPLEEYVQPEGGGFFFVLPGVDDGGWLGQQLLA
ncbi:MAG TPA: Dyp-type peroxidase [Geodermatophilus sp.]|nr:Dyp-type peroxidase [Geodermatophilus sp.]